jgi:predicted metalloprotease with PDZ domain
MSRPHFGRWLLFISLFLCGAFHSASAATEYTIVLAHPEQHLVEVHLALPEGSAHRELQLPVWNALYQIRDFSQYVNWIHAKDRTGRALSVRQLNPSCWEVMGAEGGALVEYEVFLNLSGPFGAELNARHAFLNLAEVLMYPVGARDGPMRLRFATIPQDWHVASPLDSSPDGGFTAANYDRLVDSPVEIGAFQESDFEQGGAHYRVIVDAEAGDYDMAKITVMLQKIVASATSWMEDRPFDQYMFLYHFPRGPSGGGMEHAYSTAIEISADALNRSPDALASITTHEFFHLWNVKRIRPQGLDPVDYTKENYTHALWFSEGCTSTAADFIELRSGLTNERQFETQLAAGITELERRPAHLWQSAEESSLDAWLEDDAYYRQPERSISYYNKGELLGVILDLVLRDTSQGKSSLREMFQWMNGNYAKQEKPFPESDGILTAAEAVSHADLKSFFEKYVKGTEEIPWNDFFRGVGLKLAAATDTVPDAGFAASRDFDGPMTVAEITPGSEAERAGLHVGDVILEINGKTVGEESADSLVGLTVGDTLAVKVRGPRGGEREMKWKMGSHAQITYQLKDLESVSPQQRIRRAAWLKGEAENQQDSQPN